MVKETGKSGSYLEYSLEPRVNALLYDFDIEGARLKQLHHRYIENILAPLIIRKGMLIHWKLKLVGHTSASGSQSYNKALSKRRAQAVADLIRMHTPMRTVRFEIDGAGEKYAKEWEGFLDRSVHVSGGPAGGLEWEPDPPRESDKPLPPQVGEAQLFHLRFLKITKVGMFFLGKLKIVVEITDRFKQRPHRYLFEGDEVNAGIGLEIQAGVTHKPSDYHAFWTPPQQMKILTTGDFGGDAKIKKGVFKPHDSFHFGGLFDQFDLEYKCLVQPLKWDEPSYMNIDFLGSISGPMRSTTIDLSDD